jgi:hypothetical protein
MPELILSQIAMVLHIEIMLLFAAFREVENKLSALLT